MKASRVDQGYGGRIEVVLDIETYPTQPGLLTPPAVALGWGFRHCAPEDVELLHFQFDRAQLFATAKAFLSEPAVHFVGHRIAYDMAVLCNEFEELIVPIFDAYLHGRVWDTRTRARLHDIRIGTLDVGIKGVKYKYGLEGLAIRHVPGYVPHKTDWQIRYNELIDVPTKSWPEDARSYLKGDVCATDQVWGAYRKQEAREVEENQAAFALFLSAAYGIRVDHAAVLKAKQHYKLQRKRAQKILLEMDLLKLKRGGGVSKCKKEVQAHVAAGFQEIHGTDPPMTAPTKTFPNGQIATARGVLQQIGGYKGIHDLMEYDAATKMLSTFIPPLERAGRSHRPVTPRIEPLVNSGRPSCSKPNLYNPPKKGGIRECFVPMDGNVFAIADFDGAELRPFAQTCLDWFGFSKMAEILNAGGDVHLEMTSELLGRPVEEIEPIYKAYLKAKEAGKPTSADGEKIAYTRSPLAKAAVFGGLGMLGAATFIEFCWSWNLFLTFEQARHALAALKRRFPEIRQYFEVCKMFVETYGGNVTIERGGFTRGRLSITKVANTHFQTPVAHGAKDALWAVTYLAYCCPSSPLYGCRVPLFLYDEIVLEVPREQADEAGVELCRVMKTAMDKYVPDVPSRVSYKIFERWRDK